MTDTMERVAGDGQKDGVMVALVPSKEVAEQLASHGTEPIDQIHLTLAFLGKTSDFGTTDGVDALHTAVRNVAAQFPPLEGKIMGAGTWKSEDGDVVWASPDIPRLTEFREKLAEALRSHGVPPSDNHGFSPHITLSYGSREIPKLPEIPVRFDGVTVAVGENWQTFPFQGSPQKQGMAFHPTREWYKASWDELPDHVYHVAPKSARDSILREGLSGKGRTWNLALRPHHENWGYDAEKGEYTGEGRGEYHYRPSGVYTVADKLAAGDIKESWESGERNDLPDSEFDVWKIDTHSLRHDKEHPTDVIRDPEVMQAHYEADANYAKGRGEEEERTPDEAFESLRDFPSGPGGEERDNRQWVFEQVHPKHLSLVPRHELKDPEHWDEDDYESLYEHHPEEREDDEDSWEKESHRVAARPIVDRFGKPIRTGDHVIYAGDRYEIYDGGLSPCLDPHLEVLTWEQVDPQEIYRANHGEDGPIPAREARYEGPIAHPGDRPMRQWSREHRQMARQHLEKNGIKYPAIVRNYVQVFQRATPDNVREGMEWYDKDAGEAVQGIMNHGYDRRTAATAIARLSPQNPWDRNKEDAVRYAGNCRKLLDSGTVRVTPEDIAHADQIGRKWSVKRQDGSYVTTPKGRVKKWDKLPSPKMVDRHGGPGASLDQDPPRAHGLIPGDHPLGSVSSDQIAHLKAFSTSNDIINRSKTIDVLLGRKQPEEVLSTPKIHSFADNIEHPFSSELPTIDVHMINAGHGHVLDDDETAKYFSNAPESVKLRGNIAYHIHSSAVIDAAEQVSRRRSPVAPLQAQAVIWKQWSDEHRRERRRAPLEMTAAGLPKTQVCKYCSEPATKRIFWAEGMAYVPICEDHVGKACRELVDQGETEMEMKSIPRVAAPVGRVGTCRSCGRRRLMLPGSQICSECFTSSDARPQAENEEVWKKPQMRDPLQPRFFAGFGRTSWVNVPGPGTSLPDDTVCPNCASRGLRAGLCVSPKKHSQVWTHDHDGHDRPRPDPWGQGTHGEQEYQRDPVNHWRAWPKVSYDRRPLCPSCGYPVDDWEADDAPGGEIVHKGYCKEYAWEEDARRQKSRDQKEANHPKEKPGYNVSDEDAPSWLETLELKKLKPSQDKLYEGKVKEYMASDKNDWPPLRVYRYPDGEHVIIDGHHRWEAAKRNGEKMIHVRVSEVDENGTPLSHKEIHQNQKAAHVRIADEDECPYCGDEGLWSGPDRMKCQGCGREFEPMGHDEALARGLTTAIPGEGFARNQTDLIYSNDSWDGTSRPQKRDFDSWIGFGKALNQWDVRASGHRYKELEGPQLDRHMARQHVGASDHLKAHQRAAATHIEPNGSWRTAMLRNPNYPGHQQALNLATRGEYLNVSDCNRCGHAIAWAKSKAGKSYPCDVLPKASQDHMTDSDILRAAPWRPHRCKPDDVEAFQQRKSSSGRPISLDPLQGMEGLREMPAPVLALLLLLVLLRLVPLAVGPQTVHPVGDLDVPSAEGPVSA